MDESTAWDIWNSKWNAFMALSIEKDEEDRDQEAVMMNKKGPVRSDWWISAVCGCVWFMERCGSESDISVHHDGETGLQMVPGAVSWNCPTWGVNGNVESFSVLTKYLSYYLSTPTVHRDRAGCWVNQAVRAKINSLSAWQVDALVLICHQQQRMFGTWIPQPSFLYPLGTGSLVGKQ